MDEITTVEVKLQKVLGIRKRGSYEQYGITANLSALVSPQEY